LQQCFKTVTTNGVLKMATQYDETMYTVWVGGIEATDYLLTLAQADSIAQNWIDDGFDDVQIAVYREG